ncbi:hypothetical protein J2792_002329 [Novosphingobium capsulatum]|uniref:Uncharacterized protein n=1 Tax=Novosphingobium capsulatum TaxID=13688 RepID=A0ABU1MN57_9SPHN|nr:hypothetical protein [Novosphingobium capsulatum]MDR6511457.1 hypothetical protein [Novosphingobium capsulatum]
MAKHRITANRRTVLSSFAAIGAAAALPVAAMAQPATPRTAWDAAMAEYVAAKAAMDAADPIGDDAAVGRFIKAEKAILDTRTPDMRAFRWKVERMRDISETSVIDEDDFDRLLADLRLLGDA